jgi:uncharacterized membrane protein YeaQ/YmgE (transglycosylase-associated protein family)
LWLVIFGVLTGILGYCIPLGLSKSITFDDMFSGAVGGVSGHSTNWKVDTIMQPTTDSTEVELRRRAFWHAYSKLVSLTVGIWSNSGY